CARWAYYDYDAYFDVW
nr:immunoglobulin heavy chain junction region [Mus musculus]MBK4198412.1 immunoglobulin heavy chain junction region [Mus musculus]